MNFYNLQQCQLPLQEAGIRSIAPIAMNGIKLAYCVALAMLMSCCERSSKPIEVRETRPLTEADSEASFVAVMPSAWRQVASVQFRDFNCKFGKDGEVYVSLGSGEVKENAERWLRQLGEESPNVALDKLERVEIFGESGYLVEAQGKFAGMQGVTMDGAALLGALVQTRGALVTVKMVGKADEVKAQRENFLKFCNQLSWRKVGDE